MRSRVVKMASDLLAGHIQQAIVSPTIGKKRADEGSKDIDRNLIINGAQEKGKPRIPPISASTLPITLFQSSVDA